MGIVALEKVFSQLAGYGQDEEDRRFGDLSARVLERLQEWLEESFEEEVRHKIGCRPSERSESRQGYRNGHRTRDILTRFGRLKDVRVPRLRRGGFMPSILVPGRLALPEVEDLIARCLLCGATRREVTEMVTLLLGYPPCGSIIARAQSDLDRLAQEFMHRELTKTYNYLFLDATKVTIKEGRLGKEWMVLIAVGIDEFGCKEVLGFARARTENGAAWRRLLNQLVDRGLDYNKLDLVISDDSNAIALAVDDVFGDVPVQLCWMHRMANLKDIVRKADHAECVGGLRRVYKAENRAKAVKAFLTWMRKWAGKYPTFAAGLEKDLGKLLAFFSCPSSHWEYLRTNNPLESLNSDIKSRIFGWAGFANRESCYRLLYGLFRQRNEDWRDAPKLQFTH